MKVIFVGRNNSFNRQFACELFRDQELTSCLFVEGGRNTFAGRYKKIRRRMKRNGFFRVVDELAFHVYDRIFHAKRSKQFLQKEPDFFGKWRKLPCPSFEADNIHSKKWIEYIEEQQPDMIFSICCNVIFKPKLYNIPRLGTFVLHEGLTPEYKGLHTPIWAMLNGEHEYIGYTMLRVNDEIDGGEVLNQGTYTLQPGEDVRTWSWVGHNALIQGLPEMRERINDLANNGTFSPLSLEGRKDTYYSWVTLSQFPVSYTHLTLPTKRIV